MSNKVLLYVAGILLVIVLVLSIKVYLLKAKANAVLERQIEELDLLKEQNLLKSDSIKLLIQKKVVLIDEQQKSLYDDVARAKDNNIRYEQIKKDIGNTDAADELARQLTKRY